MTSLTPNTAPLNFSHMFSFVDLRGPEPQMCVNPHTMYGIVASHPQLTKIKAVIDRSNYNGLLNDPESNSTLFAPLDNYLKHIPDEYFNNLDIGSAKQIIHSMLLPRKVSGEMVRSSPVSYLTTYDRQNRMYTTNICGQTRLNDCAVVVEYDKIATNGVVHLTTNLLLPNNNTYVN